MSEQRNKRREVKSKLASTDNGNATEIIFEDVPKAKRGRRSYVWQTKLAPAMKRPGHSARVRDDFKNAVAASRTATNLKNGRLSLPEGTKADEWEFKARTITVDSQTGQLNDEGDEQRFALYATFKPEKTASK